MGGCDGGGDGGKPSDPIFDGGMDGGGLGDGNGGHGWGLLQKAKLAWRWWRRPPTQGRKVGGSAAPSRFAILHTMGWDGMAGGGLASSLFQ